MTVRLALAPQTQPVPPAQYVARAARASAAVFPKPPARFRFSGRHVVARAAESRGRSTRGIRAVEGQHPNHALCGVSNTQFWTCIHPEHQRMLLL